MSENIEQVRKLLSSMRDACNDAVRRRDGDAFRSAHKKLLITERHLAALEGIEYAEPIKDPKWRPAHPRPLVWYDNITAWIICPQPAATRPLLCKVAKFDHVMGMRSSVVSDTLEEQSLFGKGLESGEALLVRNSKWLDALVLSHQKDQHRPEMLHFALCFKSSLVEVIAKSIDWLDGEKSLLDWLNIIASQSVKIVGASPAVK